MINKFSNKNNTWIDIVNPTLNDLSFLKKETFVNDEIINLTLKRTSRSVVYNFENYVYFVFYLPMWDDEKQASVKEEIDMIVSKDTIITVRYSNNVVPINELVGDCLEKECVKEEFLSGTIYETFYFLFNRLLDFCDRQLKHIEEKIVNIEETIFKNSKKSILKDLVDIKRDILDFNRVFLRLKLKFNSFCFFVKDLWTDESVFYLNEIKNLNDSVLNNIKNSMDLVNYLENISNSLIEEKEFKLNRIYTILSLVTWPTILVLTLKQSGVWVGSSMESVLLIAFVPSIIIYIVLKFKKLI